jgi:hypothetical protein
MTTHLPCRLGYPKTHQRRARCTLDPDFDEEFASLGFSQTINSLDAADFGVSDIDDPRVMLTPDLHVTGCVRSSGQGDLRQPHMLQPRQRNIFVTPT